MSDENLQAPIPMSEYDYHLPSELIAQEPLEVRSESRLLVLDRSQNDVEHSKFANLPDLLDPGDLLVFNDTRVIPARLLGHRESGGKVEFLLLKHQDDGNWLALAKPSSRLKIGERLQIDRRSGPRYSSARLVEKLPEGQVVVELDADISDHLVEFGRMPLPPYIDHQLDDDERYQTVYARAEGSAAAPTAGLHFTPHIMSELQGKGIETGFVTLHVGLDTFRPVTEDDARNHAIHREWCSVSADVISSIEDTRKSGGRVVAVGTTSARTLETWGQRARQGNADPFTGETNIYITPGYKWTVTDALFTNFHLPKSTLLLMVSALAGRERVLEAYRQAVDERYRFFSFGDAMIIL
jgi:S-adenosylmethionine:tRNA ribosyltransferase-isomerase